ncbi:unnamed protein product [Mesocestoides corti]|uniref:C2H2-type domain-containing protein n=1 Tax=Mesocestoides corti TaxID=53468 RepID=A0A0R3UFH3_MESCO|nr:unnamed protein product [Mesocestoides corti]
MLLLLLFCFNHFIIQRPFKCSCGRSYIRRQHLTRHEAKCDGTAGTSERSKGLLTKAVNSSDYSCPKCGAGPFSKKKTVWAHLSIVHGERRFRCDQCGAAFPTKSKLERHLSRHHNLKCQLCAAAMKESAPHKETEVAPTLPNPNERFENFTKLRKHIAIRHPKRTFICETCGQRFLRIAHLREHELRHTPGCESLCQRRTFVCTYCSPGPTTSATPAVAFTARRNLLAHIRSAHASEMRRFPCTHISCPAILSSKQKLAAHLKRHSKTHPSAPIRVFQRPSLAKTRLQPAIPQAVPPKRRKCVPLCDLQEAWETDSQSSIPSLLC